MSSSDNNTNMNTLFIDLETAPAKAYIWDLKTRYVPLSQVEEDGYVLCFAASWLGDDEIFFSSRWDHGEQVMVEEAWRLLDEADAVIHYNGNRFDIPRLNSEFLTYRLGPPSPAHQIDLFQVVSRKFKVLSRSMNHLLKVLDLDEKVAHKGMELWTNCMAGVKEDEDLMAEYNIGDVVALESLYYELLPWIDNHPNVALWMPEGEDKVCPNCGGTNLRFKGYKRTRVLAYRQYHCRECGSYARERHADESFRGRKDVLR